MASWRRSGAVLIVAAALAGWGCAAHWSYRQGQKEARKGNWDLAVARLTRALQKDPDNIGYKIALENARIQASRRHYAQARKHLAADELEKAAEELGIATKYDPGNKSAADDLVIVRERIAKREEEKRRLSDFEAMKAKAQAAPLPVPVLSPRSTAPISIRFTNTSLEKVFDTLSKLAGVNILLDEGFRDKNVSVSLSNVTFQEALDQITFVNRLFYKVLDQNTIIVVPETPAKRRSYDDVLLRTFYLQNADVKEIEPILKASLSPNARVTSNPALGAITITATPDELAVAQRIIDLNDKARGEVVVEVEILEVNRTKLKDYGIQLSNYAVSAAFAPTGAEGEITEAGFTQIRAHLLASLNLADFVVNIPSSILAGFLQTDSTVRILASPRLRAAEGKRTSLKIGTEVPVPVTTFQATQTGGTTFTPATSFQYRNVGVTLDLTPKVNASGEITLELMAEFSLLGQPTPVGGQDLPTFLSRQVNGLLRVRDGETSLIGGLLQTRESESLRGAFGLPSIPILNKLLTSTEKNQEDTEIVISITPHLVRAPKVREEDLAPLYVGTREAVRVPGARAPLFGAPEPSPSPGPPVLPPVVSPLPTPTPTPSAPAPGPLPPREPLPGTAVPPSLVEPRPEPSPSPPPVAGAAARAAATAILSPPEAGIRAGETSTVSVVLMNVRDVSSLDLELSYDAGPLEAVEVVSGQLLTLDGAQVGVERNLEPGRVRARFTRPTGASGSGVVASVTFRGARPGTGSVRIESLTFTTGTGPQGVVPPEPARIVVAP